MTLGLRERLQQLDEDQRRELAERLPPLSRAQRRLWTACQLAPGVPLYNVAVGFSLSGRLCLPALRHALTMLPRRHDALRTVVTLLDEPRQAVLSDASLTLEEADARAAPMPTKRAAELLDELAATQLDLEAGPLVRALLVRVDVEEWHFGLVLHHIIVDGEGLGALLADFEALYRAWCAGVEPPPAPPPYFEVLHRMHTVEQRAQRERDLAWWREQLGDRPAPAPLPFDGDADPTRRYAGRRLPVTWEPDWHERVAALGRQLDTTSYTVLLAALATLLARVGHVAEVTIGTTVTNRPRVGGDGVVGFLVKTIPLRISVDRDRPFAELVRTVQDVVLDAMDHLSVEFDDIVAAVGDHDAGGTPLFNIALDLLAGAEALDLPDVTARALELDPGVAKYPLGFHLESGNSACAGFVEYATARFDEPTVRWLVRILWAIIEEAAVDSACVVRKLGRGNAPARAAVESFEDGPPLLGTPAGRVLIPARVRAGVRGREEELAVAGAGAGPRALTRAELDRHACRLGAALRTAGAGLGDRIGVCTSRSAMQVAAVFGTWAAGGVMVPLDPGLPDERLAAMVRIGSIRHVVVDDTTSGRGPFAGLLCHDVMRSGPRVLLPEPLPVAPGAAAYAIFTSGSSGEPKLVAVSHASLAAFHAGMARAVYRSVPPGAAWAANAPLAFDASLQYLGLLAENHPVLVVPEEMRRDPEALVDWLRRREIAALDCTPTHAAALVDAGLLDPAERFPAALVMGGEPVPRSLWRALRNSRIDAYNVYGPTEFTINATVARLADHPSPTIGVPLPGTTLRLLDEDGERVPVCVTGEIHLGGPQVALGYPIQPRLTADLFRPESGGGRLYATGDLARWRHDGTLAFLGRADAQVKLHGYRIELEEVEEVLRRAPDVIEAAVGILDAGNPGARLVAFLVTAPGAEVNAVKDLAQRALPSYCVPSALFEVASLPRTTSGKLDRPRLAALAARAAHARTTTAEPPRTDTEQLIAQAWADLLGTEPARDDNFFDSGGHSLLAARLARRIDLAFGVRLPVAAIFEQPTLAAVAEAVDQLPRARPASTAVTLRDGVAGAVPVVLAHPLGGELDAYAQMIGRLPGKHAVWGIQSRSVAAGVEEAATIDQMLRRYTADLLAVVPHERVALIGWSLGGLIALGLAARLETAGREVVFVDVWDCGLSTASPQRLPQLIPMVLRVSFGADGLARIASTSGCSEVRLGAELATLAASSRVARVLELAEIAGVRGDATQRTLERQLERAERQSSLFEHWWPTRLRAPIHAVYASRSLKDGVVSRTDWQRWTASEHSATTVQGDHFSMLREPALAATVAGARDRLRHLSADEGTV